MKRFSILTQSLFSYLRDGQVLFWNFAFPVFLLIIYYVVFGETNVGGYDYMTWVTPGVVALNILSYQQRRVHQRPARAGRAAPHPGHTRAHPCPVRRVRGGEPGLVSGAERAGGRLRGPGLRGVFRRCDGMVDRLGCDRAGQRDRSRHRPVDQQRRTALRCGVGDRPTAVLRADVHRRPDPPLRHDPRLATAHRALHARLRHRRADALIAAQPGARRLAGAARPGHAGLHRRRGGLSSVLLPLAAGVVS